MNWRKNLDTTCYRPPIHHIQSHITMRLMNRVVIVCFRMTRWIHYGMLLIRCFLRSHSENISTTVTIPTIPHNKAPAAAHS